MTIQMRFEPVIDNPFERIRIEGLLEDLKETERRWARRIQVRVRRYPRTRPGQTYIRTYTFQGNWKIDPPRLSGGDMICEVRNENTPYAKYVVGDDVGDFQNQAYHAGRWYLFRKIVEDSEAQFRREVESVIGKALAPATITP